MRSLYLFTSANINLRPAFTKIKLVNVIGRNFGMTPKAWSDLGKFSGPTLVRLEGIDVAKGTTPQSPSVLSSFYHLRSLSLGFKAAFEDSKPIPSGALPNLEKLSFSSVHGSFVTVLTRMEFVFIHLVRL